MTPYTTQKEMCQCHIREASNSSETFALVLVQGPRLFCDNDPYLRADKDALGSPFHFHWLRLVSNHIYLLYQRPWRSLLFPLTSSKPDGAVSHGISCLFS